MFHQPPLDVHVNREILATALRGRVGLSLSGMSRTCLGSHIQH